MLDASRQRILERLSDDDVVLDVGGWAKPFARADWVLDFMPYESRGLYGYDEGERASERFSAETWVSHDICAREPWPFEDGQFDFAICSHTLEDVRDPVWVCQELQRVAKAGYIETPSRLEEQAYGVQGPWVGWGHHHWLVETDDSPPAIRFIFKHHLMHGRPEMQFPPGFDATLSEEQKVATLWWDGAFDVREVPLMSIEAVDECMTAPVRERGVQHEPEQQSSSAKMPRLNAGRIKSIVRRVAGRSREPSETDYVGPEDPIRATTTETDWAIIQEARQRSMTSVERLQALCDSVRYTVDRGIPGAFVECGVWLGGSVLCMIRTLQDMGIDDRDIYLFDTFEGMSEPTELDKTQFGQERALETWQEAKQKGETPWPYWFGPETFTLEGVRDALLESGYPAERLHFVKGKVEDTIPERAPEQIALLRLDTDWYESTRHELDHLYPRLERTGVLILDDYGHWDGARKAVDEYFGTRERVLLTRVDYSARVVVKP